MSLTARVVSDILPPLRGSLLNPAPTLFSLFFVGDFPV